MALAEARPFLIGAAVLLGACLWLGWWILSAFAALLLAGLLLFFRDPHRQPPPIPWPSSVLRTAR